MSEDKIQKLADWLKHMQGLNHSLRHMPEMAVHIVDLKKWERMVNAMPALVKALEETRQDLNDYGLDDFEHTTHQAIARIDAALATIRR